MQLTYINKTFCVMAKLKKNYFLIYVMVPELIRFCLDMIL